MKLFKKDLLLATSLCFSLFIQPLSALALVSQDVTGTSLVLYNNTLSKANDTSIVLYNHTSSKTNDTSIVLYNEAAPKTNGVFWMPMMIEFVAKFCESYWVKNNSLI